LCESSCLSEAELQKQRSVMNAKRPKICIELTLLRAKDDAALSARD
jgi:hypothetical protein